MHFISTKKKIVVFQLLFISCVLFAQEKKFTRIDSLRGNYGPYRANNDLLYYHLSIKVDPDKKHIEGKNMITFKMLKDDHRIQLDLYENMKIEKILWDMKEIKYTREFHAVFIDFPEALKKDKTYSIDFYYSGNPGEVGRLY
ncbi:MAG: hypothetical protein ACT4ON_03505 [Bacteroidota bacterium]